MNTPRQRRQIPLLLVAMGAVAALQTATPLHAANTKQASPPGSNVAQTTKKSRSVKVKHQQNHSGETTAERDRRLYRECQGLPNAGACRGYTRR